MTKDRTVIVLEYDNDPTFFEVLLAPEGLDTAEAQRTVDSLLANYEWEDDCELCLSYLLKQGFDMAEWTKSSERI